MPDLRAAQAVAIICVRDRARATAFYRDVLGVAFVGEDAYAATFDLGGMRLRVSTVEDWTAHAHPVLSFRVPDVPATVETLAERGVAMERYPGFPMDKAGVLTMGDAGRFAWFKDPEGNVLMLADR